MLRRRLEEKRMNWKRSGREKRRKGRENDDQEQIRKRERVKQQREEELAEELAEIERKEKLANARSRKDRQADVNQNPTTHDSTGQAWRLGASLGLIVQGAMVSL